MDANLIVTRHKGLIEWLAGHGIYGKVVEHVTDPEMVKNKIVFGALPFHLAVHCTAIYVVDLPYLTPEQRGKDLTVGELNDAGANLKGYIVTQLYE